MNIRWKDLFKFFLLRSHIFRKIDQIRVRLFKYCNQQALAAVSIDPCIFCSLFDVDVSNIFEFYYSFSIIAQDYIFNIT